MFLDRAAQDWAAQDWAAQGTDLALRQGGTAARRGTW